ncbi:Gfo/Idh/MocA family oxidoreductase [Candidatus Methanocrinis natronophilus]|uniref:Gfo/Idh/MocA family oxidoreductase n=1 Tax=Candidatus Methanocrinis natronophilus TaxID=3033396 RepID=A0ABT5X9M7_9EURY|nr:Gfo/Idh/MocA family oxidoreductase [Candidatus Methanocrinis natronophilus]MDF0591414.1 Gfo/Idh/MocA family oxidoreductase [Candidatus Methanocrinis natronophilus]
MDIGVIGTGKMGRNHVRIYSEMREADEVYVYDPDEKAAGKMEETFGAVPSKSISSLLDDVDAVSICVPTRYHFDVARAAIENHVSCLIEKPIASSSREAERLLEIIPDDLVVGVGHIERFNPMIGEVKRLIKNPRYIDIRRHNPASLRIIDAGVVVDLMIHDIDILWNYLFSGKESSDLHSLGDDDLRKIVTKFGDCVVSLSASRIACRKIRTIHVEEDDFTIEGDFMNQEVYIYRKPAKYEVENARYSQENIIEKVQVNKVEPLKEELKTFINSVKTGTPFPITPKEALLNLMIAEQVV